ncbi:MAG: hypothetical protein RIB65_08370 [Ilumatobacter fluminis]|uniref:hypothetical protein n=1 Tax=Ilumatobacter fluminis TaxID=467091 RepID=UPI0032EDEC0F
MEASEISLGIALVAVLVALVAAVALARQRPRAMRAAQSRHPAATPPVSLSLVREGRDAHWRVEVRSNAPRTSVDILSYRAAGSGGVWENEPIIEPIVLQPGGWAVLPSVVVGRAPTYDVVMGWTEHRPDGDHTGSGTFTVHESGPVVAAPPGRHGGWIVTAVAIGLLLLVSGVVVVSELLDGSDGEIATTPPPTSPPTSPSTAATTPTSVPAGIAATTVATTAATAPPVTTTAPPTVAPTTAPATTMSTTSTTASVPTGPTVVAVGRIEDCRFGRDCLVVGFLIDGFDVAPTEYVCEFADGDRITFGFVGGGAGTACSARSADPSITIEVAGVRSNTVTPDDLGPIDPTG